MVCVNHAIDPATFHQPKARVMLGRILPTPTKMFLLQPASQHLNIIGAMCGGSDLNWNTFAGLSWCILELYNNIIKCIYNTYIYLYIYIMSICIIYIMISVWSLNISIYIDIDIQYLISKSFAYRYHLYISMSSISIHDVCIHQHIAAMHGRTWPMYITPEESLLLTLGQLEADNKTCEAMALATWGIGMRWNMRHE